MFIVLGIAFFFIFFSTLSLYRVLRFAFKIGTAFIIAFPAVSNSYRVKPFFDAGIKYPQKVKSITNSQNNSILTVVLDSE